MIRAVRLAIGEPGQADLNSELSRDDHDVDEVIVTSSAQAYRLILEYLGFDRGDPMDVETFMAVVVRSLDERCLDRRP